MSKPRKYLKRHLKGHLNKKKKTSMPHSYFIFPTPENATCQLISDTGWSGVSVPGTHPSGRQGQELTIPDSVPNLNGAELRITAEGFYALNLRGILYFDPSNLTYLMCDDFHLNQIVTEPPEQPPEPSLPPGVNPDDPKAIIDWVYSSGKFDLSTHDGCGQFTEACCTQLHEINNSLWGHIKKNPGQNQYTGPSGVGHAVDALHCLGGPHTGIWDIVHDSVSPNATPSFNYKGPPDPPIWYYPA
jgi:hypothetical protein